MSSGHAVAEGLAQGRSELLRLARAMSLETAIVRASLAAVALHVLDDNYLQPQPGTSASDHLTSGLVPVAILLGVAVVYPRLRAGARAAVAMTFGALSLSIGFPAVYHLLHDGISGDDYTGLLATAAGATLLLSGPVILWRSRKRGGSRRRRYLRRLLVTLLGALAAFLVIAYVVFPVAFSYGYTHLGRTGPLPDIGFPSEQVTVTTDDSIELAATYVPSKNRAAVVIYPGRSALAEAKMLVRNGYGVLLLDPRGQGESQGDLVRWAGDRDLIAAAEYLQRRPDVDPGRVGGFGSSVGGEILLGAAAESTAFKAVVSEGAGLPAGEGGDVLKGTEKLLLLPALYGIKVATQRLLEPGAAAANRRPDRPDRAALGLSDLRRARHGRRGHQVAEVLRRSGQAQSDLEGARRRAHRRHRRAPGRIRAPRRSLLRPGAPGPGRYEVTTSVATAAPPNSNRTHGRLERRASRVARLGSGSTSRK